MDSDCGVFIFHIIVLNFDLIVLWKIVYFFLRFTNFIPLILRSRNLFKKSLLYSALRIAKDLFDFKCSSEVLFVSDVSCNIILILFLNATQGLFPLIVWDLLEIIVFGASNCVKGWEIRQTIWVRFLLHYYKTNFSKCVPILYLSLNVIKVLKLSNFLEKHKNSSEIRSSFISE